MSIVATETAGGIACGVLEQLYWEAGIAGAGTCPEAQGF